MVRREAAERDGEPYGRDDLATALVALGRCALRAGGLLARRRLHQPTAQVGRRLRFADGTSAVVYRETVADGPAPVTPAVLVVGFRLRRVRHEWAHALFRLESQLNGLLFLGFPGFVSKLWLRHDEQGRYRGVYEWRDGSSAVAYVRALDVILGLVSEPGSIRHAVLPGIGRDALLADPGVADAVGPDGASGWWRLVDGGPG